MNFHLFIDAPFYVDHFINRCRRLGLKDQYFGIIKGSKKIQHIQDENLQIFERELDLRDFLIKEKIDRLYVHYLDDKAIDVVLNTPNSIRIYWFLWGWDLYKHPLFKNSIYLPETEEILREINYRNILKKTYDYLRDSVNARKMENALARIDFCCIQVKGDFELVKKLNPKFKMQHKFFAYRGAEEKDFKDIKTMDLDNINLFLGNSANPSNNHIDIMKKIKTFDSRINRVVCPLSYSGSKEYIEKVIKKGDKLFGKKFEPLTKFLSLEEYNKIIDSCDIGVFYHIRQQAFSNTITFLERKKMVIMNPESTLFKAYEDFNIKNVYSDLGQISSIPENNNNLFSNLGERTIDNWYKEILS